MNIDLEKARQIVSETVSGRIRWGQMFTSAYHIDELLDALVVLEKEVGLATNKNSDELTKVKRQLTASQAREAKLKKQLAAAKSGD